MMKSLQNKMQKQTRQRSSSFANQLLFIFRKGGVPVWTHSASLDLSLLEVVDKKLFLVWGKHKTTTMKSKLSIEFNDEWIFLVNFSPSFCWFQCLSFDGFSSKLTFAILALCVPQTCKRFFSTIFNKLKSKLALWVQTGTPPPLIWNFKFYIWKMYLRGEAQKIWFAVLFKIWLFSSNFSWRWKSSKENLDLNFRYFTYLAR